MALISGAGVLHWSPLSVAISISAVVFLSWASEYYEKKGQVMEREKGRRGRRGWGGKVVSSRYMEKSAKYLYWLTVPTALDPSWQQGQRSDCVFMWKYSGEVCVGVWRTIEWSPIHSTVLLVQTNVRALRLRNILWKTKALWTLTKLKNKVSHVYKI